MYQFHLEIAENQQRPPAFADDYNGMGVMQTNYTLNDISTLFTEIAQHEQRPPSFGHRSGIYGKDAS